MFLLDTHMHFDLISDKREKILEQLERECIYTIAVTNLPKLYLKYQDEVNWNKYKYCRLALGFHPELVEQYPNQIHSFIKALPQARFIGEVGLDFSKNDNTLKTKQIEIFQQIIDECSLYKDKILTIHSRNAVENTLSVMDSFKGKAIFHWYSGSLKHLDEIVERDYFLSINPQMLKSSKGREIINRIPIEKLLIESDAPFTKGLNKEYSVFFIDKIYEYLSNTRNLKEEELSTIIRNNFKTLLT